jgi:hypothetical protein
MVAVAGYEALGRLVAFQRVEDGRVFAMQVAAGAEVDTVLGSGFDPKLVYRTLHLRQ